MLPTVSLEAFQKIWLTSKILSLLRQLLRLFISSNFISLSLPFFFLYLCHRPCFVSTSFHQVHSQISLVLWKVCLLLHVTHLVMQKIPYDLCCIDALQMSYTCREAKTQEANHFKCIVQFLFPRANAYRN